MKNSCEIVQDLIPLYSDGCASETSRKMIKKHLSECKECSAYAASYARASRIRTANAKKAKENEIDIDMPYRNLAKKIRQRRRINAACSVGAVLIGALALTLIFDAFDKRKAGK